MGWFDSQLRDRQLQDQNRMDEAFARMAGAVMGTKGYEDFLDEKSQRLSALGQILRYYQLSPVSIPDTVTDFEAQLNMMMRPHGIMYRHVILRKGWTRDADGPMIVTRKSDGKQVAILPGKSGTYRHLRAHEDEYESEAICFYKPFPLRKITMADVLKYAAATISRVDIAVIVIFTLIITAVNSIVPTLTNMLLQTVGENRSIQYLTSIFVFFACTSISAILFGIAKKMVIGRIENRMVLKVNAATMMRLLSLPTDFYREYSAGELSERVESMDALCEHCLEALLDTGLYAIFSLIYVFQIFKFAPTLAVPAVVIMIITFAVTVLTTSARIKNDKLIMENTAAERGISYGLIRGIQKIKLAGAEKRAFAKWADKYYESSSLKYNPPSIIRYNSVINLAVSLIGTFVLYYIAVKSHITAADYYSFNVAYGLMAGAFVALSGLTETIAGIKTSLSMVQPILDAAPEIGQEKAVLDKFSGNIEISHVSFRYSENMPYVLDDFSVRIKPGEYVAVVGKTGCGKSTLLRLLLGFETPQRGMISYDHRDIKSIDLKSLRSKIGVVMQSGELFTDDIYSNIAIAALGLSLKEAWEAAEIAGIADDIREMPMGMNTMVGEGIGGISGGQKQRLLIARALATKPKILFLDEATSALDNITQKRVSDALATLKCTRVVIAHRLSTIKECDRILVLNDGKIVEDGNYDELISQNGFFAELVKNQRVEENEGK